MKITVIIDDKIADSVFRKMAKQHADNHVHGHGLYVINRYGAGMPIKNVTDNDRRQLWVRHATTYLLPSTKHGVKFFWWATPSAAVGIYRDLNHDQWRMTATGESRGTVTTLLKEYTEDAVDVDVVNGHAVLKHKDACN